MMAMVRIRMQNLHGKIGAARKNFIGKTPESALKRKALSVWRGVCTSGGAMRFAPQSDGTPKAIAPRVTRGMRLACNRTVTVGRRALISRDTLDSGTHMSGGVAISPFRHSRLHPASPYYYRVLPTSYSVHKLEVGEQR